MATTTKGIPDADLVQTSPTGHTHPEALRSNDEMADEKRDPDSISQGSDDSPVIEGKDEESHVRTTFSDEEPEGPIVVPRLKRRGLFGQLSLLAEVENPKVYPRKTKWFITFVVAVAGAAAPMGSSIFFRKLSVSSSRGPIWSYSYVNASLSLPSIEGTGNINNYNKFINLPIHA